MATEQPHQSTKKNELKIEPHKYLPTDFLPRFKSTSIKEKQMAFLTNETTFKRKNK